MKKLILVLVLTGANLIGGLPATALATTQATMRSSAASSNFKKGFVEIRPGRSLYVEQKLAAPGKPTLILTNGLTYSTEQWAPLVKAIEAHDPGLGLVLYDMVGMGQTLLANKPVNYEIPFNDQVLDLKDLFDHLKIAGPVSLLGLSYGGAVDLSYATRFPNDFEQIIVQSPFLGRIPAQDAWVKDKVNMNHLLYPWDPRTEDELYAWYLRVLITSTFPSAEPIILENPYKLEAVFRMVKGSLDWNAIQAAGRLPKAKLHLMTGEKDEYVPADWQQAFWAATPVAARASNLLIKGAKHKFPEDFPDFTARWVLDIVHHRANLFDGQTFIGDPRAQTTTVKESVCETALRSESRAR